MLVELELTTLQSAMTRFLVIGRNRSRVCIDYIDFSATGTLEASVQLYNVHQCIKRALQNIAEHHWYRGIVSFFWMLRPTSTTTRQEKVVPRAYDLAPWEFLIASKIIQEDFSRVGIQDSEIVHQPNFILPDTGLRLLSDRARLLKNQYCER